MSNSKTDINHALQQVVELQPQLHSDIQQKLPKLNQAQTQNIYINVQPVETIPHIKQGVHYVEGGQQLINRNGLRRHVLEAIVTRG